MGGVVFSPCNLSWGQTMVVVMTASSKRTYASQLYLPGLILLVSLTLQQGLCWPNPLLETAKHSKAELAQFLVMATFPFPGLWCTQGSVCVLQESLAGMRLDFKHNCHPHASFSMSFPLLLHVEYFFWWVPTFSYQQLFSSQLWCWCSCRRRWEYIFLHFHLWASFV